MNQNINYRANSCSKEESQRLPNAWKRAEAVKTCSRHSKTAEHLPENCAPDKNHPKVTKTTINLISGGAK